tara:strand:+ start:10029 stop:10379 length:351 start_codon:yes stop_codon:yes gene_type:complete
MIDLNLIIIIFAGISFIVYGINSFSSEKMVLEFKRWGLEKKRKTIAISQFFCGVLLCIGLVSKTILFISSSFLVVMMVTAVYVRIKIKDNISEILPALSYLLIGLLIFKETLKIFY